MKVNETNCIYRNSPNILHSTTVRTCNVRRVRACRRVLCYFIHVQNHSRIRSFGVHYAFFIWWAVIVYFNYCFRSHELSSELHLCSDKEFDPGTTQGHLVGKLGPILKRYSFFKSQFRTHLITRYDRIAHYLIFFLTY